MHTTPRKVLISGASIAGPALAYWLHRAGFAVTLIEKAAAPRAGGYPIDIRGTAIDAVARMGILPRLRELHVHTRRITFLDPDGGVLASVPSETLAGGQQDQDIEIRRGDLTETLFDLIRHDVETRFGESITSLAQHRSGVDVTFAGGAEETFDLVVGADGLHSNTRRLTFGPEERFHRYLGYCFAGFSMPNFSGLSHEGVLWNDPGRSAALYAVRDEDQVFGFLSFVRAKAPYEAFHDPQAQRELVAKVFADAGWETPRLITAMQRADDLFFDVVSQIRMPSWSRGRVTLTGDAAHAPSFITGQGTSIALVGAYMLAHALATIPDLETALAAYEAGTRGFVVGNQDLAYGPVSVLVRTQEELDARNARLRRLTVAPSTAPRPEHSALTLPGFPC